MFKNNSTKCQRHNKGRIAPWRTRGSISDLSWRQYATLWCYHWSVAGDSLLKAENKGQKKGNIFTAESPRNETRAGMSPSQGVTWPYPWPKFHRSRSTTVILTVILSRLAACLKRTNTALSTKTSQHNFILAELWWDKGNVMKIQQKIWACCSSDQRQAEKGLRTRGILVKVF